MTRYLLKETSFIMTVKTILIVIHMKNIESLVNLGSTLINLKSSYQKGRIIVKTKQVIIGMQKMYKKRTSIIQRISLF